jgi:hypothetical protein
MRCEAWVSRLSAGQMTALFTFVNILNYLDRGIVPVSRAVTRLGKGCAFKFRTSTSFARAVP